MTQSGHSSANELLGLDAFAARGADAANHLSGSVVLALISPKLWHEFSNADDFVIVEVHGLNASTQEFAA